MRSFPTHLGHSTKTCHIPPLCQGSNYGFLSFKANILQQDFNGGEKTLSIKYMYYLTGGFDLTVLQKYDLRK